MGKKIVPVEATVSRDSTGCFLWIKSEIIEDEAKRYSSGMDRPNVYHVPRRGYDDTFLFNISASDLGSEELYLALRTKGLKDGIRVRLDTPSSKEALSHIAQTLGEIVKKHVSNHLSAIRVTLRVECDEAMIRWTPTPNSPEN